MYTKPQKTIQMNTIYHQDCITGMRDLPSDSVDCILTDPPYKYLKNQKLEVDFDEVEFFTQAKRVLKKNGFIVLFGRGTSFYRWNTMLADLGFTFKEEIVWDKSYCTSPLMALSRVHETVSIHTKGKGVINRVKVPYLEMKGHDIDAIVTDIKRLKTTFKNTKSLDAVLEYLENNVRDMYNKAPTHKNRTCTRGDFMGADRTESIFRGIEQGMNEKTIIRQAREHYDTIHPTQKPVRLLERLLALVTKRGDLVLDPFSGSGSTAVACINAGREFVGYEIDSEYHSLSAKRIQLHAQQLSLVL